MRSPRWKPSSTRPVPSLASHSGFAGGARPGRAARPHALAAGAVIAACAAFGCLAAMAEETPKGDLDLLERRWHKCVRQAFSGQPAGMPTHAAQKAALSECKSLEDQYVSAMLVAQAAEAEARRQGRQSIGARARGWASSLLSYVVEPVSTLIDAWRK